VERERRIARIRSPEAEASRSLGGQLGSAATVRYFRSLPSEDQAEKLKQITMAQLVAKAKREGKPPPILIEQVILSAARYRAS
jgi:hypothetical protein